MAIPTADDIKALDFGYLTGADLIKYCPVQLLIKQHTIDDTLLESSALTAYAEIQGKISTRYDITTEFAKTGENRYASVVKLAALAAVRNVVANLAGLPEHMENNFTWLNQCLRDIQAGQMSLPGLKVPVTASFSETKLVSSNFNTLG